MSEKQVCEEQKKLEERLLELERRGVWLESEMRRHSDESLVDWFLLIHEKSMLVRRDTELQHLEDQQIDVEFEIRCLFNKPGEQKHNKSHLYMEQEEDAMLTAVIQRMGEKWTSFSFAAL
ncbi:hypothetical protein Q8A67_001383 [Cirrhinus molitorella]|uniref:BMERB domain-containing protein n=1 Tax=Cirrhinus molitorella TaxID=172907 RepID=A0AA88QL74_9TELE|nr:hypothetical protein Q8A67_001383 [Cirrhinus molitorella]